MRSAKKADWGDGPRQHESDEKQWTDSETGLECMMRRGPGGHWCGYVGVAEGHALHGKGYDDRVPLSDDLRKMLERPIGNAGAIPLVCYAMQDDKGTIPLDVLIDVHGSLTFAGKWGKGATWWLGFDCAHAGDLSPAYGGEFDVDAVYRDGAYVEAECAKLARQIRSISALIGG